jgi:hypothetical protein
VWPRLARRQEDNTLSVWLPEAAPRNGGVYLGGYAGGRLFDALGLRVLQGRGFTAEDGRTPVPRVAIVNEAFVAQVLNGAALGRVVRVAAFRQRVNSHALSVEVRVVGVIESAHEPSFAHDGRPVPAIYIPVPLREDAALASRRMPSRRCFAQRFARWTSACRL